MIRRSSRLTLDTDTMPFKFEGPERGLADLAATVDTVISIPNDRLMKLAPKGTRFLEAFKMADDVLRQSVQGIPEIMLTPGMINRDFSDIRAIMSGMGRAMLGSATARGENAAVEGARGVLINFAGSSALTLDQFADACSLIFEATKNEEVHIGYGLVHDEDLGDEVKVTVIATGFSRESAIPLSPPRVERAAPKPAPVSVPYFERATVAAHTGDVEANDSAAAPPTLEPAPPPPAAPKGDADPFYDIDMPAFLRRERSCLISACLGGAAVHSRSTRSICIPIRPGSKVTRKCSKNPWRPRRAVTGSP